MKFLLKSFKELSLHQLFEIYKLRSEVFVVEQNCAYQDVDDKDLKAHHLLMFQDEQLVGYCRILPPNVSYKEPAIGRVVTNKAFRRNGFGKLLMQQALKEAEALFPNQDIVISAQLYLLKFYTELGFAKEGEEYLEDNIPHIQMRFINRK